jgi:hypothetical protein
MPRGLRILCLASLYLLTGLDLGQSRPAAPVRIPLAAASQPVAPAAGVEAPALYELARAVASLPVPGESQGIPYDRQVLLSQPEAFVGVLITLRARHVGTAQVRLESAPEDAPGLAWSTLVVDGDREPLQVLSVGRRPEFARLDRVRCAGYFYRIRLDQAKAADRTGKIPEVHIPVLVGWVLPDASPTTRPSQPAPLWQIFGGAVAAALVLFFAMMVFARRRVDWRTRVAQRRRRTNWFDKTDEMNQL